MQKKKKVKLLNIKRGEDRVFTSSNGLRNNKEMECPRKIVGGTLVTKATFQNLPNGKITMVKIKLPTLLFIECFEICKFIL